MSNQVQLADGTATHMGEGVFVIQQRDDQDRPQSVVVTTKDMGRLLRASSSQPRRA